LKLYFFTHSQVVWRDEATGVVEAFKTPLYGRGFRNPALNNVGRGSSLLDDRIRFVIRKDGSKQRLLEKSRAKGDRASYTSQCTTQL
ncbi:MAG TPA: hypothetical protein V6D26_24260, partial [Stenomitos sp.]